MNKNKYFYLGGATLVCSNGLFLALLNEIIPARLWEERRWVSYRMWRLNEIEPFYLQVKHSTYYSIAEYQRILHRFGRLHQAGYTKHCQARQLLLTLYSVISPS